MTRLEIIFSITHPLSAVFTLSAFAYKLRDLARDPQNLALRALCYGRLFNGLAYVMLAPVVYLPLGRLTGSANIGTLLGHAFIVFAALCAHLTMVGWFHPPKEARRRVPRVALAYLVALGLMIVLFFSSSLASPHPTDFEVYFADHQPTSAYLIVFLLTYGLNLANTARHTWPSSRALDRPELATSLRLTALGSACVLGFILGKLIGIVGRWCGTTALDVTATVWSPLFASAGSLVLVVGYTQPGWRRSSMSARIKQYRSLHTLYPLWSALCRSVPGIALIEPHSPRLLLRGKTRHLLQYRMVIEILDGRRALRPYVCPDCEEQLRLCLPERKHFRGGHAFDPLLDACVISLAIHRRQIGLGPTDDSAVTPGPRQPGAEFVEELAWLQAVAEEFAALPSPFAPLIAPCPCTSAAEHRSGENIESS
ncbi:MAB_1171c family putative transporter [Streptomyces sp. PSAA01]|uniref:MAB_1171c family putative transporter n=1 Tax=Streptomyces sp. PSAA01 TaxID=2912762 RepID=UPI001F1CC62A|nr:MAB_1171c family putative transporter [Streptomyces sp. PSAA01]MCG0283815.1 hypothetical protein [Streptomyces sp. PSAA01]